MLSERGVIIEVLNMGTIDNTPTGKLIRNIMLSFSEFEHDLIVQRTQEGKVFDDMVSIMFEATDSKNETP